MRNLEKRREWMRKAIHERRTAWIMANGPCQKCGGTTRLEIDHKDRSDKRFNISWLWLRPAALAEELKKCWVLCHNCHQAKTVSEQRTPLVHGTLSAYKNKTKACRCTLCRAATAKRERDRRAGLLS